MIFNIEDLGCVEYLEAYKIQKKYVERAHQGESAWLLLCEHPEVLTLGRLGQEENVLVSKDELDRRQVKLENIDRGGDITLHSPGQLVVYPILDLRCFGKDLHDFMRKLEQVAIDLLEDFDIVADRFSGRTGVWVGRKKIVSIGIGVQKWISFHGMAINVNTDLKLFSMIKPCGLEVKMTSMEEIQRKNIDIKMVKESLIKHFTQQFQMEQKQCIK